MVSTPRPHPTFSKEGFFVWHIHCLHFRIPRCLDRIDAQTMESTMAASCSIRQQPDAALERHRAERQSVRNHRRSQRRAKRFAPQCATTAAATRTIPCSGNPEPERRRHATAKSPGDQQGLRQFRQFKEVSAAAAGRFDSGWAWLVLKKDGELAIYGTNQDNPIMGATPL